MPSERAASSDAIRRQVRRCRWRRNVVTVQTVVLGTVAALLAAATGLLVAALVVEPVTFALSLVATAVVVAVVEVRLVARAVGAWVRSRDAPAWIDRTAGLGGHLTTLLALGDRPRLLMPVLRAENERRRKAWLPERLVPTPFPVLALAAVLLASVAFLTTLSLAPSLEPPRPDLVDAVGGGRASAPGGLERLARRLLGSGPEDPGGEGRPGVDAAGASPASGLAGGSDLDRLPASLQARIRRRLWGERWGERERRLASRTEAARAGAERRGRGDAPNGPGAIPVGADAGQDVSRTAAPDGDEPAPAGGAGEAGSGAGTGTDPDLFGDVARSDDAAGGRFALGLEARVFGGQAGPRRPSGAPVPPDADEHPALAARPRAAEPFHTMAVPPAYAPIVRAVFTHRATGGTPP